MLNQIKKSFTKFIDIASFGAFIYLTLITFIYIRPTLHKGLLFILDYLAHHSGVVVGIEYTVFFYLTVAICVFAFHIEPHRHDYETQDIESGKVLEYFASAILWPFSGLLYLYGFIFTYFN